MVQKKTPKNSTMTFPQGTSLGAQWSGLPSLHRRGHLVGELRSRLPTGAVKNIMNFINKIFKSKPNSDTGSRLDVATGRGWGWVTWVKGGRPPAPGAAAPVMATGVSHTQLTAY